MELKPGYKQTEVEVIPEAWDVKRLGEIGRVVRGGSPRPAGDPKFFDGDFIPWLTVAALTNIPDHQLEVRNTETRLTEEGSKRSRRLQPGTVIIANSGATLGVAKVSIIECCANDGVAAIIDQHVGEKAFVCHCINAQTQRLREVVATGNGQPNLNTDLIKEIAIPWPPQTEQAAIAECISDLDKLLRCLEEAVVKKQRLKQATIQELLTGKRRLPGFDGEWEVKRLGDLAVLNRINIVPAMQPDKPFVHFSLPAFDDGKNAQVEPGISICSNKFSVPASAILVSKLNPRIPRVWAPQAVPPNAVASTEWLVLTPQREIDRNYLLALCSSSAFCEQMELAATGTTGSHQRISPSSALNIQIMFAPQRAEQIAISSFLSDMDTELAALETRLKKNRDLKQGMMQELISGRIRLR